MSKQEKLWTIATGSRPQTGDLAQWIFAPSDSHIYFFLLKKSEKEEVESHIKCRTTTGV